MTRGIDDFPDDILPSSAGNSAPKRAAFSFGGDDRDDETDDEVEMTAQPAAAPETLKEWVPKAETPHQREPAQPSKALAALMSPNDWANTAQEALLDPSVKALSTISNERFYRDKPTADENSRVTRGWLVSLDQRDFFLAVGYPGFQLYRMLEGMVSLSTLRSWCDGLELVPGELRKILMLEHLLERRTQSTRDKMPRREQIEAAFQQMPKLASVAAVLGGFENMTPREAQANSYQLRDVAPQEVATLLRVVKPGDRSDTGKRTASTLPASRRSEGVGRPLGKRLLKPDSYCYTLSKRSTDKRTGIPRMTPKDVMALINQVADLEVRYKTYYSMRRRDTRDPWSKDNVEMLPQVELDRERSASMRGLTTEA